MNKKEHKKTFYKVSIGPILLECLNRQRESIKEEGYGVLNLSFYDCGEVLGKKVLDKGLV